MQFSSEQRKSRVKLQRHLNTSQLHTMVKRRADEAASNLDVLKNGERSGSTAKLGEATLPSKEGMGEFEDAFEDEIESDEDVVDAGGDGDDDEEEEGVEAEE